MCGEQTRPSIRGSTRVIIRNGRAQCRIRSSLSYRVQWRIRVGANDWTGGPGALALACIPNDFAKQ